MKQITLNTCVIVISLLFFQSSTAQNVNLKWIGKSNGDGSIYEECKENPNCKHLGKLVLPSKGSKDGKTYNFAEILFSFVKCKMSSLVIPNGYRYINLSFRDCAKLTSVTLPNSITTLKSSFSNCPQLLAINIPNSVTKMEYCFCGCKNLSSITISDCLTVMNVCFNGCKNLSTITIPNSVTIIDGCFRDCPNLSSITISKNITKIDRCFGDCPNLKSITILNPTPPECIKSFGPEVVNATLYVPKGALKAYQEHDEWKQINDIKEME